MKKSTGRACVSVLVSWLVAAVAATACLDSPVISGEELDAKGGGLDLAIYGGAFTSVDVLLVADDSLSMQDKRSILAEALAPVLFDGRPSEEPEGFPDAYTSSLPPGTHIGVISTSLSSGGIAQCSERDRRARLHPLVGEEADFLITTLSGEETDAERLAALLDSIEDSGCGYEAPLEAAYRFLVDPEPPERTTIEERGGVLTTVSSGVDEELLRQRKAFLRPDSTLAVVLLTDEDDCSIVDSGPGFRAGLDSDMPRASSSCLNTPESECCRSCDDQGPAPEGCGELEDDPACRQGPLAEEENHPNLRCFDPKRRFGVDFLFPVERYVKGFTQLQIEDRNGKMVENPLFAGGREPGRVFFGAIVGVPWQMLATEASVDAVEELRLMSPQELTEADRWRDLVGPSADPHLVPATTPREPLAEPGSKRWADPWHSHEYDNPSNSDLQYSCVFPLEEPRKCEDNDPSCDCAFRDDGGDLSPDSPNSPLCQAEDNTYGQIQYFAKAYPPPRILKFMQQLGDQAQLGSVCPKTLKRERSYEERYDYTAYGYRAALRQAVVEPLRKLSPDICYPSLEKRQLSNSRCRMFEVHEDASANCDLPGRAPVEAKSEATIRKRHKSRTGGRYLCEVLPAPGDADDSTSLAYACQNDLHLPERFAGYCIAGDCIMPKWEVEQPARWTEGQRLRVHPPDLLRSLSNGETLLIQVCSLD